MIHSKVRSLDIFLHNDTETISRIIYYTKDFFEYELLDFIKENYNKQSVILDIGANIGNHSLYFSEFLIYDKIIAFEIYDKNFELLEKNMKNKKCDLYLMGLGEKEEILSLWNSSPHNCGGYSIHYYKDNIYESKKIYDSVKIRTLDSYHFNNISMIKIDVESNELQVLKGAIETIKKYRPIIFIENAGHAFDHVELSQFDIFFKNINYTKKESNIKKSYIDLWIPE